MNEHSKDSKGNVFKTFPKAPDKTLPGGVGIHYVDFSAFRIDQYEDFPVKTIIPIYNDEFRHCWGVHLPRCKSQDFDKYFRWCFSTFGYSEFEMDGGAREFWFKKESNRTMFILKWA